MSGQTQGGTLLRHLVETAFGRKTPSADLLDRASVHTTERALMGHCAECGCAVCAVHDPGGHGAIRGSGHGTLDAQLLRRVGIADDSDQAAESSVARA